MGAHFVSPAEPSGRERATREYFLVRVHSIFIPGEMKCVKRGGRKSKLTEHEAFGPRGDKLSRD